MDNDHKLDLIIGFVLNNGYDEVIEAAKSIRKNLIPCEAHSDLFGQICAVTGKTCISQCKILKDTEIQIKSE